MMSLPLTVSCFSKIQIGFTFLVPAHPGSPGQRAVKRLCVVKAASSDMFYSCHAGSLSLLSLNIRVILCAFLMQVNSQSATVQRHTVDDPFSLLRCGRSPMRLRRAKLTKATKAFWAFLSSRHSSALYHFYCSVLYLCWQIKYSFIHSIHFDDQRFDMPLQNFL